MGSMITLPQGGIPNVPTAADLPAVGSAGQVYIADDTGILYGWSTNSSSWVAPSGSGTVTSVSQTVPASILSVSGSPVTGSGTLALSLVTQTANFVWAGPTSGAAANPSFRALVAADIPSLSSTYLPLAGGTMTGAIAMGSHKITGLTNGSLSADAVAFGQLSIYAPLASPTFTGTIGTPLTASSVVKTDISGNLTTGTVSLSSQVTGTLPVANGGTGVATLTAYAVLCAGTTSTGALQQVSGLGSSGQVLTSNGASALPTWQAAGGGGANTALSNLASVAINASLIPTADGTLDLGTSTGPLRWGTGFFKNIVGTGNLTFSGGNAFTALYQSGAQSKPCLYLYDGSGGTVAWYANAGSMLSDFGGTVGKAGFDSSGMFLSGGFGRYGKSATGNWETMQIFGTLSYALEQNVTSSANFTVSDGKSVVILNWGSTAATLTITTPANVEDGTIVEFYASSSTIVTALTVTANTGQTIKGTMPAAVQAGSWFRIKYRAADTGWYGGIHST